MATVTKYILANGQGFVVDEPDEDEVLSKLVGYRLCEKCKYEENCEKGHYTDEAYIEDFSSWIKEQDINTQLRFAKELESKMSWRIQWVMKGEKRYGN